MNSAAVCVIGGGLIGGSIALALTKNTVPHFVLDIDSAANEILFSKGDIQTKVDPDHVGIVFIAVAPKQTVSSIKRALESFPNAIVADVSSVKGEISKNFLNHPDSHRYVSSHPMAGKEISGASAADAKLFADRVWIVCSNSNNRESAEQVKDLVSKFGAVPVDMNLEDHDFIMAVVSHLPQLISYELAEVAVESGGDLNLAGQGFRDMTRISTSDPDLWTQILSVNKSHVKNVLDILINKLKSMSDALERSDAAKIFELLENAQFAATKLPGKHGGKSSEFGVIKLRVKDEPGSLASLFTLAGEIDLNIEDVIIEHVLNRPLAVVTIMIDKKEVNRAKKAFSSNGWDLRE